MTFLWQKLKAFPVVMPGLRPEYQNYAWRGIYGVQIGSWFFGVIRGDRYS